MKKITVLFLSLFICSALIGQTKATHFTESFDGSGLPSGWTIQNQTSNWSVVNSSNAGGDPWELRLYYNPSFNGKTRVISPVIDLSGFDDDLVISFIHYLDNYSGGHMLGIETTSDGGTTWNSAWQSTYSSTKNYEVLESIYTPDIGSSTFQFCLYYQGYSYNINYWYFDNFELFSRGDLDASITSVNNITYVESGDNKADFTFMNKGFSTITSMEVQYRFNDLAPVTETFSSLNLLSLESKSLSFSGETLLIPGTYDLKVNILKVNGTEDDVSENNIMTKEVYAAVCSAERKVIVEHFTSSTCGPCVSWNSAMKTLLNNNPDKYGITKYQMSWPTVAGSFPNGDPYYTAEGGTRRGYYGVNAVPQVYFNAKQVNSVNQTAFNAALNEPAFLDVVGTFSMEGSTISVEFDVASYIDIANARVYVAVNEKRTTGNVGTNGETEFLHVMMKMLPNAEGTTTSFTAGEQKSFGFTFDMSSTKVEELDDLEVHVFVQEYDSKYMFNGKFLLENMDHPYAPVNLVLQDNGDETITATWSSPQKSTHNGYNLYLNGELLESGYLQESYTASLTEVGLQVFGVNAIYDDIFSVRTARHIMVCGNEVPKSVDATVTGREVVLTWEAPDADVDTYIVYLDGTAIQGAIQETTFTHAGVDAGEYIYGVASVKNGCISDAEEIAVVVECSEPPKVFDAVQEGQNVLLSWEAPNEEVESYSIYFDGEVYAENIVEVTYTFINAPIGEHTFGVASVTYDCVSEVVDKTIDITVGIADFGDAFKIYPNPANDFIQIEGEQIESVKIYNSTGQLIKTIDIDNRKNHISTAELDNGLYHLQIISKSGKSWVEKIVIMK